MSESIARTNYQLLQEFLACLERVYLVSLQTRQRYDSYLRLLLLWAGGAILEQANLIEPTFPQFLVAHVGQNSQEPLSASTLRKATQLARRFFCLGLRCLSGPIPRDRGELDRNHQDAGP